MLPSAAQADEIQRDAADLRRSMRITLWSYVLRIATPVLLIIVIRLYGAGPYGVFAVVTAILTFLMRVTLLGLDKGLLWWLPRQPPGHPRAGLGAVLALTSITSSVAAVVVALALAPWLAAWADGLPQDRRVDGVGLLAEVVAGQRQHGGYLLRPPFAHDAVTAPAEVARRGGESA